MLLTSSRRNGLLRNTIILIIIYLYTSCIFGKPEFQHQAFLDSHDRVQLLWNVDDDKIIFEVRALVTGYVGIGFSNNGGMRGADIILAWVKGDTPYISDRHGIGNTEPEVDVHSDYELLYGSETDGLMTIGFRRKLVTCDVDDYDITGDTTRVIWSYHPDDPVDTTAAYHGPQKRGVKSIIFMDVTSSNKKNPLPKDVQSFDFLINNIIVPNDSDTTYWFYHMRLPKLDRINHIIKIDPIIQPGNEGIVHHLIVKECHGLKNINGTGSLSIKSDDMYLYKKCSKQIYAWSIGGGSLEFPRHVGYPIGDDAEIMYLQLNIHYDNPQLLTGIRDSSGVRIYYTPTLRKYESSMMMIGFPGSALFIVPPKEESFAVYGACSATCTKKMFAEEDMKIFSVCFHAHLAGVAMRLTHYRNGRYIGEISRDSAYDFNLQEFRYLKNEWIVKPGDDLLVECIYNTVNRQKVTFGGLATTDEMCSAFLFYYPKVNAGNCYSIPQPKLLDLRLENVTNIRKAIENTEWTTERKSLTRKWWYDTPRKSRCTNNFLEGYSNFREKESLRNIIDLQNENIVVKDTCSHSPCFRTTRKNMILLYIILLLLKIM